MKDGPKESCPQIERCPMFSVFTFSGTLRIWQDNYCRGDFRSCARYTRSQLGETVPQTLMPNGKMLGSKPPASGESR